MKANLGVVRSVSQLRFHLAPPRSLAHEGHEFSSMMHLKSKTNDETIAVPCVHACAQRQRDSSICFEWDSTYTVMPPQILDAKARLA